MHPAKYLEKKILSPQLTRQVNFAFDNEGFRFLGGPGGLMGIIPKDPKNIPLLMGLINSKLYDFYMKHSTQIKQGKYFQFGISHLTIFPISTFAQEKEKVEKIATIVSKIEDSHKKIAEYKAIKKDFSKLLDGIETVKLDDFPSIVFDIKTKKLGEIRRQKNTVYLNLVDSISCKDELEAEYVELKLRDSRKVLEKAEDITTELYKISIPKNTVDIEKVVSSYSEAINAENRIVEEIELMEKEIDSYVYKLFSLSPEQIDLVEKFSLKEGT